MLPSLAALGVAWFVGGPSLDADRREDRRAETLRLVRALAPAFSGLSDEEAAGRLDRFAAGSRARLTLVDESGNVVGDSAVSDAVSLKNLGDRPEILGASAHGEGVDLRPGGTPPGDLHFAACRVPESRLLLRVALSAGPLRREGGDSSRPPLLWIGLALLAGLAGSLWIVQRMARPLGQLLTATEAVQRGQMGVRVPGAGEDEIARLVGGFNAMTGRLEEAVDTSRGEASRLAAVLQGMSEGVIAIDGDETVYFVNGAARAILGVAPDRETRGAGLYELVRDPKILELVAQSKGAPEGVSAEVVHHGPPRRTIYLQATPLGHDSKDRILVLRDLSPLRRLERMRSDFVSNVSHELRTPIASISAAVENLGDPEVRRDDASGAGFLEMIARNVARLETLLDDILALSRFESSPETLARLPCDFSALCRATVEDLKERARSGGVDLAFVERTPVSVVGDPTALRRIVDNLVMNAITYTPRGGRATVEVGLSGDVVTLLVRDTGIGIPEADRERIFERFYRVDRARSRSAGGTGLGLAIAKHAARLHGGDISVESRLGGGSTFTLRIPGGYPPGQRTDSAPRGATGAET